MTLYRNRKTPTFKPQKDITLTWPSFNGGWNTFSRPTELKKNELAQADNLMLVGVGTPTGRWGSATYHLAGSGRTRMLDAYYNSVAGTNLLLSITDLGYLTKKSGASYSIITGASFASGFNYQSVQLSNNTYIASASQNFIRFDGTSLIPYVGLSAPTNVSTAMLSYASGFNTWSWQVDAVSNTGRTLPSEFKSLASLPLDLTTTAIKVTWDTVSAASGVLTGYNIYRGTPGNERFLASVDKTATQFIDTGEAASEVDFPAAYDESVGPKAKYILKVDDRIILSGFPDDPSKVLISGRYPYHDKFTILDGGNLAYISPNDGDDITGLGIQHLATTNKIVVIYKKYSAYVMTFSTVSIGPYNVLDPQVTILTNSFGASSGDTIIAVENDTYSFGNRGLYSTGQEQAYLNQIRSNELSARIRPYIQNLSDSDFEEACAAYVDYKYILSFPTKRESIIYDRQRNSFMGPWKTPFGITKWLRYFDSDGVEKYLAGCDDGIVRDFSTAYISDSGTAITKTLRSKKEDFDSFEIMKIVKYVYFLFRNVRGSISASFRLEDRTGNTVTAKSFTVSSQLGTGGWGGDSFGDAEFGDTDATITITGDELVRWIQLFTQARTIQLEISSSGANANFEFLAFKAKAVGLGPSSLPSTTKV